MTFKILLNLQKAVEHLKQNYTLDEILLKHIAPLGWEYINLLE